mmetsp:Transcript_15322/g.42849  ORF Transcript_15322/g.42849 Transcript_15322/m.42849 type:complete len:431 (+) Transcript_15322:97-1389(+)
MKCLIFAAFLSALLAASALAQRDPNRARRRFTGAQGRGRFGISSRREILPRPLREGPRLEGVLRRDQSRIPSSGPTAAQPAGQAAVGPRRPTVKGYSNLGPEAESSGLYPKFKCDLDEVPVMVYPTDTPDRSPCVELPLPERAARLTRTTAPGFRPDVNLTHPGYLFVFGTPYGGTTALLGLLSSSPNVAVPDKGWAHEAHWVLGTSKVFPFQKRFKMRMPQNIWPEYKYDPTVNIEEVDRVLHTMWDPSKPVKVDKSHSLVAQAPQLYQHYRAKGSVVKFIFLVRHPCTYSGGKRPIERGMRDMRRFKFLMEEYSADSLLVPYEAFVRNPQEVADRILAFYPELGSLDITGGNLTQQQTQMKTGNGDRGMATGGENHEMFLRKYIDDRMRRQGFMRQFNLAWCESYPPARKEITNEEGLDMLRFFGYIP